MTPDYAEPIVGWRVWDVVRTGDGFLLRSRVQGKLWTPRTEAVAHCYQSTVEHDPNENCVCGIHAAKSARQAVPYLSRRFKREDFVVHRVIGRVSLWGTVVVGSRGLRGTFAYPRDIYVPDPQGRLRARFSGLWSPRHPAKTIASGLGRYGMPVEVLPYTGLSDIAGAVRVVELREMVSTAVIPSGGELS